METGTEPMERSFGITNKLGLHARAAAQLVRIANRFTSEIKIGRDEMEVNAKSIMGVLMLAAPKDTTVVIRAEGDDAAAAIDAIGELIQAKFGEE
ncbi:MAG TPA: HPr family phosphocarrier protein [Candidatus Deferrimicrobiaceae bacterium]|jgi:phosphocarrier protein